MNTNILSFKGYEKHGNQFFVDLRYRSDTEKIHKVTPLMHRVEIAYSNDKRKE